MEAKGFYRERSSRVAKTLFPRNKNSPRAVVKKRTPGKRSPASSLRQGKTAKRLVTKKAAAVSMSLVRDNKDRWMADIEQRLAVRTAKLTAERARVVTVDFKNSAKIGSGMRLRQPSLQQQRLRAPFEEKFLSVLKTEEPVRIR
uniref:Uncharacterized protein n=1 Tax=Knipowitschia caucasica TaxID=637954 RepID=A0AAV2LGJ8_KNICA